MAAMAVPPAAMQAQSVGSLVAAVPSLTQGAVVGGGAAGVVFPNSALYVGDLEATVDENKLYDLFSQVAPVVSVRVCRDQTRRSSLGYGYVNFNTPMEASNARDVLNFTPVNGKPIRIMFSHRDPSLRRSGYANLFIKNLDPSIDHKALYETFSAFGNVLSCKVAVDHNEKSKGYGFVQFDKEEAAQTAIKRLNGMLINDKQVYVGTFVRRQERNQAKGSPRFTNFGPITSAVIMKDPNGRSKCFGFINFETFDAAAAAVENLNGSPLDDKVLYVGKAEKKAEREAELKAKFERERSSRFEKLKGANLYLKNLEDSISDEKLKELFSEFGTITSCKLMRDPNGVSKGAGFVAFSTPEEATKALNEMNGKMIGRKPLYVAVAQRKEERKAWLQAHFAQMRTPGTVSPLPGIPGFHTSAPRLAHQQLYFPQVGPGLIPQAPAYGFQQQHLPGLQSGVPSNFVMPYQLQRQGQPGQRLVQERVEILNSSNNRFVILLTTTSHLGNRNSNQGLNRYMANPRNGANPSVVPQGLMGPMVPLPLDSSAVPGTTALEMPLSVPLSRSTLASALASATPDNQRMMLGEQLYPLVERLEPNHTGKVTGMLLEMDQTEVLHLIESPDALKKKVVEAMDVLRLAASGSDIGD
ncbi:UNVERIFIED_CONTAM: Polyadenylate-binding protein 3 [Sesamum angustifolium]|uniref:Polyadenylate-binding protein 3 n=1 Tax=Sesamum angustifolium TaxID=2727405 RepID=A0AAW2J3L9_9LAMI